MTTVTGSGEVLSLYGNLSSTFLVTSYSSTGFTTNTGVTVTGTGLTYSSDPQPDGTIAVGLTGGTITGVVLGSPNVLNQGQQTYSNLSVDGVAASHAIADAISGNPTNFNNLFFGGDDTFTWSGTPQGTISGYGGNDTFNISNWGDGNSNFGIDGGSGSDTLNISGGINGAFYQNNPDFNVANIETVNLAAGSNYTIIAPTQLVTAGNSMTINASALGAANSFVFSTNSSFTHGSGVLSGNLVLIGGAGNDTFQGGSGNNTFIGGGGSDTVSFDYGLYATHTGVTVNLSISGPQSVGGAYGGTDTFQSIENLVGTVYDDTLTGDANDNVLDGNGGNDTINGGAGFDTAVFHNPYSSYTITHSGNTTTVSGSDGTSTLTGVELGQFTDRTVQISGPVVTTNNKRVAAGQSVALSSLFSVNDLNGAAITQYQLWDGTRDPNAGYFTINGVAQPAGTVINVTAAQLAQTAFVGGADSNGLQIRAYDGTSWSAADNAAWAPFVAGPSIDNPPVVTTSNVSSTHNQTLPLSSLFSVSDADGDAITQYQLWDGTRDPNSGYFTVGGVVQPAAAVITISAAQLAQTNFVTGKVSDALQIRAYDGYQWSAADNAAWAPFTVSVPADIAPIVQTFNVSANPGQIFTLHNLVNYIDVDGDPAAEYQLWESTSDPNAGYFTVAGVRQPAGTVITVTADQAAQTSFVPGTVAASLQIRASDGMLWSASDNAAWAPFTVTPPIIHPPVVTTSNVSSTRNQTLALSSLFSVSDPDGHAITQYQLWDSTRDPNSGYFTVGGVAQPAGTVITISASQLAQTNFVTGKVSNWLQIRAYDGVSWSAADNAAWAPFTVSVPADNPPIVSTSNISKAAGQTLSLSSLVSVTDADGDPVTEYQLWDSTHDPNAGHWVVAGVVQPAGAVIDITAAQAAQTSFVTGTVATSLQVRASDGILWSAADNANWAPFTVTPLVNHPPVVTTSNTSVAIGSTVALSSLFGVSDADGDSMTKYELWDSSRDPNAGYYTVNGARQAAGTVIDITAAQLGQTSFVAGSVATSLQIRAFDGQAWSAADNADWAPFTVSPPPPVVTTADLAKAAGQTLALSSLFSVSDANGLPITEYQLWDSTGDPNSGHFALNGAAEPAHTVIDITAAQMAQTSFVTGTVGDALQIRAFDGISWSAADTAAWSPFHINIS